MTRRERLERRIESRRQWAEARDEKARAEFDASDLREEKSGIPLGQPILVGHHSERRHRRALERADAAMRRGVEHVQMAKLHRQKAAGLEAQLDRTIYSDDPDAVEALEARIAELEAEREKNNAINRIVRGKPRGVKTPEKIAALVELGLHEAVAEKLFEPDFCGDVGISPYVNRNLGGRIRAALQRLEAARARRVNAESAEACEGGVAVQVNAHGNHVVTFAEKPAREILDTLKAAGYRWRGGSWVGEADKLPAIVRAMAQEKEACHD